MRKLDYYFGSDRQVVKFLELAKDRAHFQRKTNHFRDRDIYFHVVRRRQWSQIAQMERVAILSLPSGITIQSELHAACRLNRTIDFAKSSQDVVNRNSFGQREIQT